MWLSVVASKAVSAHRLITLLLQLLMHATAVFCRNINNAGC